MAEDRGIVLYSNGRVLNWELLGRVLCARGNL